MWADSLPAEPQGKFKNTGVGSLTLLQLDLPDSGIELGSLASQAVSLPTELWGKHLGIYQERKDSTEYRELWGARAVQRSAADASANVSCSTFLPKARIATDHSSPAHRMIHLLGSHPNKHLYAKMCYPYLSDL